MPRSKTCTTELNADYDKVFDFLSAPENMPRWTVFARKVEPKGEGDRYVAETPQGEATLWVEDDHRTGEVVYHWEIEGERQKAPSRLERHNGSLRYAFTIYEPPGAPDGMLNELAQTVEEELSTLKDIAERELQA